jgi:aspartate aminotransferase
MNLSVTAQNARPSATLALNSKAKAYRAAGKDVVLFTVGEPDFDTPENIRQAAHDAIRAGQTRYTPAAGTPALRQAIADKLRRDNGLDYPTAQVFAGNGGKHVLIQLMMALVGAGDEVLLPAPYWVSYRDQAEIAGAQVVEIDTTNRADLKLTPEALEAAITPRSKLLVLNYPSNPTGVAMTAAELRAVVDVALAHELWIISDEVYEFFLYDGAESVSIATFSPEAAAHTITVNAVSKTYAMTGWRLGYAAGPADVISACIRMQSNMTSGPCSIAQAAAVEALNGPQDSVPVMRDAFDERRKVIVAGLNALAGVRCAMPQGAFYAFADCSALFGRAYGGEQVDGSMALAEQLLEQVGLAVVPGAPFGADNYLRFSYATSLDQIERGLAKFAEFVVS